MAGIGVSTNLEPLRKKVAAFLPMLRSGTLGQTMISMTITIVKNLYKRLKTR